MDTNLKLLIVFLCGLLVSGCTSLSSTKLYDKTDTPPGLTYRLPAKLFSINATYEITGCTPEGDKANLEAFVETSFTESLIGSEAYTINYQDLNTWTKVTNTEFQLSESGLLTGVNASIVDQSGAVILNSVSAAASIAKAIALPGVSKKMTITSSRSPTDSRGERGGELCIKVNDALVVMNTTHSKLNAEKGKDEKRKVENLKINEANLQISALNNLSKTYGKLGYVEEQEKLRRQEQLQQQEKELAEARLAVLGKSETEELEKKYAKARSKLIVTASHDFIPGADSKEVLVPVKITVLKNLFDNDIAIEDVKLPEVKMTIVVPAVNEGEANKAPLVEKTGIAYRIPVTAVVRIHLLGIDSDKSSTLLAEKMTQIPQLGPIGSIDLNNKMFDDNLIELAFNGATGAPSKLTFRAKSKAEAASATVRDAAGTYMQLQKDKRDDQVASNKALLDQATAQVALEKAKTELTLSTVQANATAAKTKAELQQSLVSSQVELLRDQQRLDAVRTGTATAAEVELEALNTQHKLLAQRLQILKLEQEIAEQKVKALSVGAP